MDKLNYKQSPTTIPNLNVRIVCSSCKEYPPNLEYCFREGDLVCTSCGLVIRDHVVEYRMKGR